MIFSLFLILSLILIINISFFRGNICNPSILFVAGFWVSALWAWIFQDRWGGFQNPELLVLVSIGVISFSMGCFLVKITYLSRHSAVKSAKLDAIRVSKYKLYLYLLIEFFIAFMTIFVVLRNTSSNNIFVAIGQYYNANKYNYLVYEPSYIKVMQYFNIAGVFIAEYIVINNKICREKNPSVLYFIIAFGMGISLCQGIRNTFFMFVISGLVLFYLLRGANKGWKSDFDFTILFKVIFFVCIVIAFFQVTTIATGRISDEFEFIDILSTYIGTPLKNLELYLSEDHSPSQIFGAQTFMQTYNKLYELTGDLRYRVNSLYQYRWIGIKGLGNVYTILMPLYQDFGFVGAGMVLLVIGAVSEVMYERLQRYRKVVGINLEFIIYAYCAFPISFGFFSNKYFEMVVSVAFIYTLISLFIVKFLFVNVKLQGCKIILCRPSIYEVRRCKKLQEKDIFLK